MITEIFTYIALKLKMAEWLELLAPMKEFKYHYVQVHKRGEMKCEIDEPIYGAAAPWVMHTTAALKATEFETKICICI